MAHLSEEQLILNLILEIFRSEGDLSKTGDNLVKDLSLSSAKWKVLGALKLSSSPLTVSDISKRMGQSRQSVQRVANDLNKLGFISFIENPNHQTAKLLLATDKGKKAMVEVDKRKNEWVKKLVKSLSKQELNVAISTLQKLQRNIKNA